MGAGSVTTTGLQSYADNVVLGRATTLTGSGASFQSLSGSANDLTLNVSVSTAINGANFLGVRNLTVGGDGTATLSGAISTTGTQTYSGAVTLSANTVLTSVGAGAAGNVALRNVSGNGNNLIVNSSAGSSSASPTTIAFNGVVSGVSLLDVDSGVIDFNAALSAGDISLTALNGGIDVGADVTATASNTLDAAGAITGTGRISGAAVALIGDAGVGTAGNHLNTTETTLTASSSGGGVFIN